jgi:hypothetical protein
MTAPAALRFSKEAGLEDLHPRLVTAVDHVKAAETGAGAIGSGRRDAVGKFLEQERSPDHSEEALRGGCAPTR